MIAHLVPATELGKIYGLLAILDAALPFLSRFHIPKSVNPSLQSCPVLPHSGMPPWTLTLGHSVFSTLAFWASWDYSSCWYGGSRGLTDLVPSKDKRLAKFQRKRMIFGVITEKNKKNPIT